MTRVLITGGHGFIGGHLAAYLQAAGDRVRVMDLLRPTGVDRHYRQGNVTRPADCRSACRGMDVVVHGAAIHPHCVAKSPCSAIDTNVRGTLNLLHAAVQAGVRRFVFLSSAKVYGQLGARPSSETDLSRPVETYALTKTVGELYCRRFQEQHGIETVIIRPFSVYGPGQDLHNGYVGMLLAALRDGAPLVLPGGPKYRRDFVYVADVVRLCALAVNAPMPRSATFNAASGESWTLSDLVALGESLADTDLAASFVKPAADTIRETHGAMDHAAMLLGYRPEYDLLRGLAQTVTWLRQSNQRQQRQRYA